MRHSISSYLFMFISFAISYVFLMSGSRFAEAQIQECIRAEVQPWSITTMCCIVPYGTTYSDFDGYAREIGGPWEHCRGAPHPGPHCDPPGWAWWQEKRPWIDQTTRETKICWRFVNEKHDKRREAAFDLYFNWPSGSKTVKPALVNEKTESKIRSTRSRPKNSPTVGVAEPRNLIQK